MLVPLEAVLDGLHHPEILKLAGLGAHGTQPSHVSRDLVRSLAPAFKALPEISTMQVPIFGQRENEILQIDLECQFPHDIFSFHADTPLAFAQLFGTPQEVASFWAQKDLADPGFAQHPAVRQPEFRTKCIPARLHSDGVVLSRAESLHCISWSSYFGQGSLLEVQLLFTALVKSAAVPSTRTQEGTMDAIYTCLDWSFRALLDGKHPSRDWLEREWPAGSARAKLAGTPLHPDGFFVGLFQITGDLEELANNYGLSHWASNDPCFWCFANTGDCPWSDLSPQAAWRANLREPRAVEAPPSEHRLWRFPGMSRWCIAWDVLHGLDLGPTLHTLGNVLEEVVALRELGRSDEDRVRFIWSRAQQIYRELAIENRLPKLDLNSWRRSGDFPKLRAKGNEARHFVPVVRRLVAEFDGSTSRYAAARARLLDALVGFYEVLDSQEQILTADEAEKGKALGLTFLREYNYLSHHSVSNGELRWQMTLKMHYLAHACDQLVWANPKHGSTYRGESFVGKISKVALSASYGKPAYVLGGLLMQKLQAGRAVRIRKELS